MAKQVLLALLAVSVAAVAVEARWMNNDAAAATGRQLSQAVNTRCPAGCASDGCVLDSTSGGYKCIRCKANLVVNSDDGTCGCPAGRYAKNVEDCSDCDKGSFCLGGRYVERDNPGKTDCATDLTTIGKRSTSVKACVNVPGTFFSLAADGAPSATTCPVDTYGPGLRKQRACVPCPPGYTTNSATGQSQARSCVVPEGYYLKGPGQVAPCPKGEYKEGFAPAPSCTKCAAGVTTAAEASKAPTDCKIVLPGFYPYTIASNGAVSATQKCPQKFYCTGGTPSAAFDPTATPLVLTGTTVAQCPQGTWTENIGATSADQCMTPPGYYTTAVATLACADGEYRADWKPAAAAGSCSKCGDNILSTATEQIASYAITPDATKTDVAVRASAASCYIKPGQGMYFSAATSTYKGVNCDSNNYGVSNITYGLAAYPCRDCPAGMQTSTALSNSQQYYVSDAGAQGFTGPMACVTKAGFGYNGRIANKCPAGSWNPAGTYSTCTQCGFGLSTPDNADSQVDAANCTLAKGYGFHDNAVQLCPVGTYNDALRADKTSPCTSCPTGLTTSQAGAASVDDCNVCALGYGGSGVAGATTCPDQCGGSAATYGPAARAAGSACVDCPAQSVGFSFDYLAQNQLFAPAIVARSGADSAADCLSEFAQIVDAAWYLGGSAALSVVPNATAPTFQACVDDCKADATCQYITFNYDAPVDKCSKKVAGTGTDVVAFKAVVAGDTSAASTRNKKQTAGAKGLSSGSYTFWQDSATGIGADTTTTVTVTPGTTTVQDCLSACDNDAACAAVALAGINSATDKPTGCTLIKGVTTVATWQRTMTRAVSTRLSLSALF